MQKIIKYFLLIFILLNFKVLAKENFFQEAKDLFDKGKIEESKFLFQRNIVFNPKDSKSYLYLAKIFNKEGNDDLEENNLNTVVLLNPKNEEAIYLLAALNIKRSDFFKAKELIGTLEIVCEKLCSSKKVLLKELESLSKKQ